MSFRPVMVYLMNFEHTLWNLRLCQAETDNR